MVNYLEFHGKLQILKQLQEKLYPSLRAAAHTWTTVELMCALCLWPAVTPDMDLKPNSGSDRAWVWNTLADYADECPKAELLAIRFLNAESEY